MRAAAVIAPALFFYAVVTMHMLILCMLRAFLRHSDHKDEVSYIRMALSVPKVLRALKEMK